MRPVPPGLFVLWHKCPFGTCFSQLTPETICFFIRYASRARPQETLGQLGWRVGGTASWCLFVGEGEAPPLDLRVSPR